MARAEARGSTNAGVAETSSRGSLKSKLRRREGLLPKVLPKGGRWHSQSQRHRREEAHDPRGAGRGEPTLEERQPGGLEEAQKGERGKRYILEWIHSDFGASPQEESEKLASPVAPATPPPSKKSRVALPEMVSILSFEVLLSSVIGGKSTQQLVLLRSSRPSSLLPWLQ
jgi:hypothetical protein